jgi:DNA polymerase-1
MLAKEPKLDNLFWKILNPAVRVLFNMERRGLPIDTNYLRGISGECLADMQAAEKEIYRIAGQHFNLGSTKDLSRVLFHDMGLPVMKQTAKGASSTDKAALEMLAEDGHKIAESILRWRHLSKLYSAYIDPDAGLAAQLYKHLGSIHPNFNQCSTATGRLACSDPNAQQIPRNSAKSYYIRKGFIPHRGKILLGGDFSQIELRIMAHMSGDKAMCEEYCKDEARWKALLAGDSPKGLSKSDLHQRTADACNCARDPTAKNVNFLMLYGGQSKRLAQTLTSVNFQNCLENGVPFDHLADTVAPTLAQEFIDRFFGEFPGVRGYQEYIADKVMRQGYIETRFGRKRRLPDVFSSDRWLKMAAQRQAVNHTIQGHVGELALMLMCKTENVIDNPHGAALRKLGFRLHTQIHDEFQGECDDREQTVQDCKYHLTQIFQQPLPSTDAYPFAGYRVPIIFEIKAGYTWAELK